MHCQFSFGPNNAFFFQVDSQWAWSDNNTLPQSLRLVLEDPAQPDYNKLPYDVALAMEPGVYGMCWRTKNDEDFYEADFLGPHYAKLGPFMGGMSAHTTDIMGRIKLGRPETVALGMRGAYVVLYDDSVLSYSLQGLYPALQSLLDSAEERTKRNSIVYVALSPYTERDFFVAFGNGTAQWNLPAEMEADVRTVCAALRPLPSATPGQPNTTLGTVLDFQLAQTAGIAMTNLVTLGPDFVRAPTLHSWV
ncbi:hypothetical protein B0H17DRAFT_1071081 [Mycena rosella]|uniref:Uncharacterized protein n=1 Tax=Mycena rosella TaxID=1033263 RepID=A0AAD7DAN6_MYCRO|nr:hypothetical protein B0H17DRAFT_1071081 [Mycena rosella]